jgi:hypothetical protein
MMQSQKVVIPAKAGIHGLCNKLKFLDSRFHGNDEKMQLETFCERIKYTLFGRWGDSALFCHIPVVQDFRGKCLLSPEQNKWDRVNLTAPPL